MGLDGMGLDRLLNHLTIGALFNVAKLCIPHTYYPNLPIFLHGYIILLNFYFMHIKPLSQCYVQIAYSWRGILGYALVLL